MVLRNWFSDPEIRIAKLFVQAMNARDAATMASLMASDMVLIDSAGSQIEGRDNVREMFERLFAGSRHFNLDIARYARAGESVLLTGLPQGDHPGVSSSTHFRVRIADGLIAEWCSHAQHPTHSIDQIMTGPDHASVPAGRTAGDVAGGAGPMGEG